LRISATRGRGNGDIKISIVNEDFADEFLRLSSRAQKEFDRFAKILQDTGNPYSPEIQHKCVMRGNDRFEYPLKDGYFLLWKVYSRPVQHSELHFEMEVLLLSLERN